jgi:crotonobetainyl-CoA:carnitine CoA-transferase CaiB-like acyl-CoA transferase
MTYLPLKGIKVLELARLLPGPMVTRSMADLGAEVVKVEEPGLGDYLRWVPPLVEGSGILFQMINRGKKSLELDMRTPLGLEKFLQLTEVADVVVEGARPGSFSKSGVDWEAIRKRSPHLVVCSVSGFGQSGPLARLPSHGYVMDALSGCMTLTQNGDELLPSKSVAWSIEIGCANAAFAIVSAVLHAKQTGEGAWIDSSMWDSGVESQRAALGPILANLGSPGKRARAPWSSAYLSSDDSPVMMVATEQKFWVNFCRGVKRPDLINDWFGSGMGLAALGPEAVSEDPAASDPEERHFERLRHEIAAIIATAPAAVWTKRFVEWDVAGGEVVDISKILDSPHLKARDLVRSQPGSPLPIMGHPVRFMGSDVRPGFDSTPPPKLGEHTDQVLSNWLERHSY